MDEGIREIKIEGYDYTIPEKTLLGVLSYYGEIISEVMEDLFNDGVNYTRNQTAQTGVVFTLLRSTEEGYSPDDPYLRMKN